MRREERRRQLASGEAKAQMEAAARAVAGRSVAVEAAAAWMGGEGADDGGAAGREGGGQGEEEGGGGSGRADCSVDSETPPGWGEGGWGAESAEESAEPMWEESAEEDEVAGVGMGKEEEAAEEEAAEEEEEGVGGGSFQSCGGHRIAAPESTRVRVVAMGRELPAPGGWYDARSRFTYDLGEFRRLNV